MDKQSALSSAKTVYAAAAKNTGRALHRLGVVGDQPPSRDDRLRHWAYSLTRVHDSLAIAELDVPWWTYRAIDVVDSWLQSHPRPIRIFEYGSGASTLWLAKRADEVHSVEHHRGFGEYMSPVLEKAGNIDFRIVEPVKTANPTVPSAKEDHAGLDFADYVATIDQVGGKFDLIVIDGRAREACLRASLPHLADSGMVVFDNTKRRRYLDAIAATPLKHRQLRGLTPTLPYPDETSLLTW